MNKIVLVSIIIPAYNEESIIQNLLISIKKQSYKNIEVIVIDDASNDRTADISRKYTNKVFVRKHAERSIQRNFGVKKAKGKYLLFLDADMELSKNVVEECVRILENDGRIGGIVIPEESVAKSFWEKIKAFERSFYNEYGDLNIEAARFFRKSVFEEVGGYDESITGPEDWDLPESIKKMGYKIGRVKSLIYHHERIANPLVLAGKKYYYGLKAYRYFEKQKVPLISAKTIYFLRPAFYRSWKKIITHPILSGAMFLMFLFELIGGGMGFLVGKYTKK